MKKYGKTMKRFWPLYLMFMPGVVYLFINCYIPMFGIQIAFRQYNARDGIYGSPWCGLIPTVLSTIYSTTSSGV